jgi:hypothetical protein
LEGRKRNRVLPAIYRIALDFIGYFFFRFSPVLLLSRYIAVGRHLGGLCYPFRFAFPPIASLFSAFLYTTTFCFYPHFSPFYFVGLFSRLLASETTGGERKKGRVHFSLCWFTSADLFWLYLFVDVFPQSPVCTIVRPIHVTGIITYGQHALNVIVSTCLFDMERSAMPQQQRSTSGWALSLNIWNIHTV